MATHKHNDKNSSDMVLKPDPGITFGNKASLKRSEETGIPLEDEMVIAILEGDKAGSHVNTELATAYAGTIIRPDLDITYPDRASLRKRTVIIPVAARYAAAAVILLLISVGAWLTFSPASSPLRVRYDLATLETKVAKLNVTAQGGRQLSSPSNELAMIPARDLHVVSALLKKEPDPLQAQFSMSIADIPSENYINTLQPAAGSYEVYAQADPEQRTFIGKVFNGMISRVKAPFERSEAQAKPGPERGFSIWDIAELGVKGVNTLGDHDYTLVRDLDENGNVKRVILLDE